jgi:hypothetical protein
MKIISFVEAADGEDPAEFQQWYLGNYAPQLVEHSQVLNRFVVNVVDLTPTLGPELSDLSLGAGVNRYQISTEAWVEDLDDYRDSSRLYGSLESSPAQRELEERAKRQVAYLVDEAYQILGEHPTQSVGERLPGIKHIALCLWKFSAPRSRDFWREHAARALPFHVGIAKYVQNWVVEPLTPASEPLHGIAHMYFPTEEDFRDRFFSSREGFELVSKDVKELKFTESLFAGEYLLKGEPVATGLNADYMTYVSA